jgi:hypothetical protein
MADNIQRAATSLLTAFHASRPALKITWFFGINYVGLRMDKPSESV